MDKKIFFIGFLLILSIVIVIGVDFGEQIVPPTLDNNSYVKVNSTFINITTDGDIGICILEIYENITSFPTVKLQEADIDNLDDARTDCTGGGDGGGLQIYNKQYGCNSIAMIQSGYMKFNMSKIPVDKQITSAILYLYTYNTQNAGSFPVSIYEVLLSNWTEETLKSTLRPCGIYDNNTNCNITAESTPTGFTINKWASWNLTNIIQRNIGNTNVSFLLRVNPSYEFNPTQTYAFFYDKEYADDITKRPYLNITYSNSSLQWNNYTMNLTGTTNAWYNKTEMADGEYLFRVWCNDTTGNSNLTEIRNFTLDTTLPILTYVNLTTTNDTYRNPLSINVSVNEINLEIINISVYNSTGIIYSNISSSSPFYVEVALPRYDIYYFNATANDSAGNIGYSETIKIIDTDKPNITLTEAGNTEGIAFSSNISSHFYRNGTKQVEDWMYIEANITDNAGIHTAILEWKNETGWFNFTMNNDTSTVFYYNMTNQSKYDNYTFNIWANDTIGNETLYKWLFYDYNSTTWGAEESWRKYVGLNESAEIFNYSIFYFYHATNNFIITRSLSHEQPTGSTATDTGIMIKTKPSTNQEINCGCWINIYIDDTIKMNSTNITNIYYHFWWGNDLSTYTTGYDIKRSNFAYAWYLEGDNYTADKSTSKRNITIAGFSQPQYYLDIKVQNISKNLTANDINLFSFGQTNMGSPGCGNPSVISTPNYTSWIILNVPDNATLATLDSDGDGINDSEELYLYYTNPFDASDNTTIDSEYPLFYNYSDNNATLQEFGTANFSVNINSTNGTVGIEFNGTNYTATNTTNLFNITIDLVNSGIYHYYWWAYGNGTLTLYNKSALRSYTVNLPPSTQIGTGGADVNIVSPDINTSIPVQSTEEKGLTKGILFSIDAGITWLLAQISPKYPLGIALPIVIVSIVGVAYLITYRNKKKNKKEEVVYYE